MRLLAIDMWQNNPLGAMTWLCCIENRIKRRHIIMRLKCNALFSVWLLDGLGNHCNNN